MKRIGIFAMSIVGLVFSVQRTAAQTLPSDLESVTGSQAGCPMQIVGASFERPGRIMLVAQGEMKSEPTLHLDYGNFGSKDIESLLVTGWVKVKHSPYQLDYTVHPVSWELSSKHPLGKDARAAQTLVLASDTFGLDRIELSQVIYTDGTTWKPERQSCVYRYVGTTERAEAQ